MKWLESGRGAVRVVGNKHRPILHQHLRRIV